MYLRFQETSPSTDWRRINDCQDNPRKYVALTDSVTGDRVAADNIVVIYVSHTFANGNEQDDEIYHIDLIDSGRAYVFRDGLAFPARWTRTDIDQPLVLTTASGEVLACDRAAHSSRSWARPARPGQTGLTGTLSSILLDGVQLICEN